MQVYSPAVCTGECTLSPGLGLSTTGTTLTLFAALLPPAVGILDDAQWTGRGGRVV